jgi:hypothetical protein
MASGGFELITFLGVGSVEGDGFDEAAAFLAIGLL